MRGASHSQDTGSKDAARAVGVQASSRQWIPGIHMGCRLGNGPDGNVTLRNSVQQKQVLFLPESWEFPGAKLQFLDQELTRGRQDIRSRRKQRTKQLDPGSNSDPRKEAG